MIKKNILVHAINGIGLGHIRRTVLVARELAKLDRIWKIVFVTNSTNPFLIENAWFEVRKLDYWIEDTLRWVSFSEYEDNAFEKMRKIVREENIDIVLHDTYFVRRFILESRDLKHFLILRDSDVDYLDSIESLLPRFKRIYIPHVREELSEGKQRFYGGHKNVCFVDYIVEDNPSLPTGYTSLTPFPYIKEGSYDVENKEKKIIVSPWYGGDYENTLEFFSYVNELLKRYFNFIGSYGGRMQRVKTLCWQAVVIRNTSYLRDYEIIFVLGKHSEKIRKKVDFVKSFKVVDFLENLNEELWSTEIFIWRWGYNSLNEVLVNGCKALLFGVDRFAESQRNRIDFFASKFGGIRRWVYDFEEDLKSFDYLFNEIVGKAPPQSPSIEGEDEEQGGGGYWEGVLRNNPSLHHRHKLCKNLFPYIKEEGCKEEFFNWVGNLVSDFEKEISKENILVFKHIFLPRSENFIFEELVWLKDINPVIFTLKKENLDEFENSFELLYFDMFKGLLNLDYPKIYNKELYGKFLKMLVYVIKKYDIKTVYTEFLFDAYFVCKIKSLVPDVRIVSAWRGYDVYSFLKNDYVSWGSFLGSLDKILVRDFSMRQEVLKYLWDDEKVEVVRSVLDLSKYSFVRKNFSKLDILIWGRFVEKKWILELLDLIKLLVWEGFIWKVWLVWDGDLRKKILTKIDKLWLSARIEYYGFLSHKDFVSKLNQYNCFMNYSKVAENGDCEWISNMVVENMLSWNLVFSTVVWGLGEVLEDGESWVVLSGDVDSDFEKVKKFFEDGEFEEIVERGRKRGEEFFSDSLSVGEILKM